MESKRCNRCNQDKTLDQFYFSKNGHSRTKYSYWCKNCLKEYSKERAKSGYYRERHKRLRDSGLTRLNPISPYREIALNLYEISRQRAKRSNIDFTLTANEIEPLIAEFCDNNYYTEKTGKRNPFNLSLDRIDSSNGYTLGNIRICWLIENYCKNSFTDDDVIEFCKRKLGLL